MYVCSFEYFWILFVATEANGHPHWQGSNHLVAWISTDTQFYSWSLSYHNPPNLFWLWTGIDYCWIAYCLQWFIPHGLVHAQVGFILVSQFTLGIKIKNLNVQSILVWVFSFSCNLFHGRLQEKVTITHLRNALLQNVVMLVVDTGWWHSRVKCFTYCVSRHYKFTWVTAAGIMSHWRSLSTAWPVVLTSPLVFFSFGHAL